MTERFLLDTCTVLWIAGGASLGREASVALSENRGQKGKALYVSAISGWEIGLLISKGRLPTTKSAMAWFGAAMELIGAEIADVSLSALMAASFLPRPIHNDPADCIIIATAREQDLTIITRDRAILAYGAAGHVKTLAC